MCVRKIQLPQLAVTPLKTLESKSKFEHGSEECTPRVGKESLLQDAYVLMRIQHFPCDSKCGTEMCTFLSIIEHH